MVEKKHYSLLTRVGVAFAAVVTLGLVSMISSVIIADSAEGDSYAINLAGSLRMQSYRIVALLQRKEQPSTVKQAINDFEQRLSNPILQHVVSSQLDHQVNVSYREVVNRWQSLKPQLLENFTKDIEFVHLQQVDKFVNEIDELVKHIEVASETKIYTLRAIQVVTLFLTLLVIFIAMYNLHARLMVPLKELVQTASVIRDGGFNQRSSYQSADELGLLSNTFNQMLDHLTQLNSELEKRVEQKTATLQRTNRVLETLYETSRWLNDFPQEIQTSIIRCLKRLQQLTDLKRISVCLKLDNNEPFNQILSSDQAKRPPFCQFPDCEGCKERREIQGDLKQSQLMSLDIKNQVGKYGELLIENEASSPITDWQLQLLQAFADMVATACNHNQFIEQKARLAMMSERAVIARELHDSLAQSLSYQKLQVARLRKLLQSSASTDVLEKTINEVQQGLNAAYRHLRELLSTFRLKIDAPGLEQALKGTVKEFQQQTHIQLRLDYKLQQFRLTAHEEIHCLQIAREALSNAIRHSNAKEITLSIHETENGQVELSTLDNGVGIDLTVDKPNHYGLIIIQERVNSLKGTLTIRRCESGGTEVKVEFTPQQLANNQTQIRGLV
ncbi:type IV pili methyl-accepting chemotaxis transducer N-terminal domain-containing protein [Spartinivicinus poritis]|uniref:Sensor protein n=1 Tax=Spartinivicinus poritis TaxID=2994640 RepID=A0ABT5U921_9GAMM|nr:type IV pili methyl-accepting chemotaxis transducer N-terminal domain-containing protein [Spartinivicinus sp. A2-2]MDE1462877.1 type IV pili methyl-accepting chemotaxis transducer N-terminal domain-containing protein [Spartinivicinus sp. A2-2]